MVRQISRKKKKIGLAPGTLVHIGKKKLENIRIRVIDYNESELKEHEFDTIEACFPFKDTSTVSWINIDGLHDLSVIEKIGNHFGAHPLMLEDIPNTRQRPKLEDYGDYFFVVLKMD